MTMTEYEFTPKQILKSGPCTIVFWWNGTKTIVRRSEDAPDDDYAAFSAAIAKHIFESNSRIRKVMRDVTEIQKPKKDAVKPQQTTVAETPQEPDKTPQEPPKDSQEPIKTPRATTQGKRKRIPETIRRKIRAERADKGTPVAVLAAKYGVSVPSVYGILKGASPSVKARYARHSNLGDNLEVQSD